MIDIHELGVVLGELAGDDVRERVRRIERRQHGDPEQNGVVMQADEIVDGFEVGLARVDDIIDLPFVHQLDDGIGGGKSVHDRDVDAEVGNDFRRPLGGVHRTAKIPEFFGDGNDVEFILIVDRHIDADGTLIGRMAHFKARRNESLEHGFLDRLADSEHFARRLHLRTELRINVVEFFETEHGHFDRHVRRCGIQSRAVAEFFELRAHDDFRGKFHHRHARHLGNIRNGARRAGVDFDDVKLSAVNQILNIDESFGSKFECELRGHLDDALQHGVFEIIGRIDGDRVARMDARALDMLHDAGDEDVRSVGNGVHFEFGAHEIFIAQNGVFYSLRQNDVHVAADVLFRKRDRHVLSADDVRGAKEHGIFQLFRGFERLLLSHDGDRLGTGDGILFEERLETLPILRHIHAVRGRAENADSVFCEIRAEIDRRLPAEGDDDAVGLFHVDDVLHVFRGQGFEIQPVRRVEVGGNRFGIVVDDDDLVTEFFERPYAMDGGIVELNALTDTNGSRADDDDAFLLALCDERFCFVVIRFVVGRIEIRRPGSELRGAGVHHLEHGFFMEGKFLTAEFFDVLIEIAEPLSFLVYLAGKHARRHFPDGIRFLAFVIEQQPLRFVDLSAFLFRRLDILVTLFNHRQFAFVSDEIFEFVEEPAVDLGDGENFVDGDAALQSLIDDEEPFVRHFGKPCE